MITTIRKHLTTGLLNKIFLGIVVLSLMGVFSLPFLRRDVANNWYIKVNKQPISYDYYWHELQRQEEFIQQLRAQYGTLTPYLLQAMGIENVQQWATENLIKQALLTQYAHKIGINVSAQYVENRLLDASFMQRYLQHLIPYYFYSNNILNPTALRTYLQRRNISSAQFMNYIKEALDQQFVTQLLQQAMYIPVQELQNAVQSRESARKFTLLKLPFEVALAQVKTQIPSDEELKKFFEYENMHTARYIVPESRVVEVWEFNPDTYNLSIAPEAVERYYESHRESSYIQDKSKVQIRQIVYSNKENRDRPTLIELRKQLVEDPTLFAQYAQQYSDDKESAKKGGLLEEFSKGTENKKIESAAFALKEPGALSNIIKVDNKEILLQLVKKTGRTYKPLESVQDQIKRTLLHKEFAKQFNSDMKTITGKSKSAVELSELAKQKQATSQQQELKVGINQPAKAAFKIKKEGNLNYYIENDKGYVVKLVKINKKYTPALSKIKEKVLDDWYIKQAQEALYNQLQSMKKELKTSSLIDVAKKHKATFVTTNWVSAPEELKSHIDTQVAQRLFQLEMKGMVDISITDKEGILIQLTDFKEKEVSADTQKEVKQQITQQVSHILTQSLIASLYRDATIEIGEANHTPKEDYTL